MHKPAHRTITILLLCAFWLPATAEAVVTKVAPGSRVGTPVEPVIRRSVTTNASTNATPRTIIVPNKEPELVKTWFFSTTADFPVSSFDSGATHQLEVALSIYEGMRVDLYDNGNWKAHYQAAPTATPVTAEIQIWLEVEGQRALLFSIPPAVFRPDGQEAYGKFATGVKVKKLNDLREQGKSHAVYQLVHTLGQLPDSSAEAMANGSPLRLVRTGRALVGYGANSLR